jgi:hypothetical protein
MASDKILNNTLTWGDDAKIIESAPKRYHPGEEGSVCGVYEIIDESVANEFSQEMGSKFYTIEFGDGSSVEVPEMYLKKI